MSTRRGAMFCILLLITGTAHGALGVVLGTTDTLPFAQAESQKPHDIALMPPLTISGSSVYHRNWLTKNDEALVAFTSVELASAPQESTTLAIEPSPIPGTESAAAPNQNTPSPAPARGGAEVEKTAAQIPIAPEPARASKISDMRNPSLPPGSKGTTPLQAEEPRLRDRLPFWKALLAGGFVLGGLGIVWTFSPQIRRRALRKLPPGSDGVPDALAAEGAVALEDETASTFFRLPNINRKLPRDSIDSGEGRETGAAEEIDDPRVEECDKTRVPFRPIALHESSPLLENGHTEILWSRNKTTGSATAEMEEHSCALADPLSEKITGDFLHPAGEGASFAPAIHIGEIAAESSAIDESNNSQTFDGVGNEQLSEPVDQGQPVPHQILASEMAADYFSVGARFGSSEESLNAGLSQVKDVAYSATDRGETFSEAGDEDFRPRISQIFPTFSPSIDSAEGIDRREPPLAESSPLGEPNIAETVIIQAMSLMPETTFAPQPTNNDNMPETAQPPARATAPAPQTANSPSTPQPASNSPQAGGGGMQTAVQITLSCEIASMQLTPTFKMGALQLRPASKVVTMRLAPAPGQQQSAMNLQVNFEISKVQPGPGTLGQIRLNPSQQQKPQLLGTPSLGISGLQLVSGFESAPLQLTPQQQGQPSVQLTAAFQISTVEFSPTFDIAGIILNAIGKSVSLQLPGAGASTIEGAPVFEIVNIQLTPNGEIALLQLSPAGGRRS
ncbi:MAG: hypothetical protein ABI839_03735 [Verrucomicrobiota bacterium]